MGHLARMQTLPDLTFYLPAKFKTSARQVPFKLEVSARLLVLKKMCVSNARSSFVIIKYGHLWSLLWNVSTDFSNKNLPMSALLDNFIAPLTFDKLLF